MTDAKLAAGVGLHLAVVVVAVLAGGATATSALLGSGQPTADVPSAFVANDTSIETSAAAGEVNVTATSTGDVVVVDLAHGNDQDVETVQTLERVLVENGYGVRYHRSDDTSGSTSSVAATSGLGSVSEEPDLNASLQGADAYVIVNPSEPYDRNDTAAVAAFADAGGRVLVMSDPGSLGLAGLLAQALGVGGGGPPDALAPVSSRFGVGVGSGYLYNMAEYDGNYQTVFARGTSGSLSEGVDRVSLHRAAPVVAGPDATVGIQTGPETELSTSGTARRYAVAARNGNVAIVGDTSLLDPARLHHADNEVLVGNLVEFLVGGGSVAPSAIPTADPASPSVPGGPPAIAVGSASVE